MPPFQKEKQLDFLVSTLKPKEESEIQTSSVTHLLKEYKIECNEILNPSLASLSEAIAAKESDTITYLEERIRNADSTEDYIDAKRSLERQLEEFKTKGRKERDELINQAKTTIKAIKKEEGLLSESLTLHLDALFTVKFILLAEEEYVSKIVTALEKRSDSKECKLLVGLIKKIRTGQELESLDSDLEESAEEELEANEMKGEEKEVKKEKLSFAELIALKKQNKENQ